MKKIKLFFPFLFVSVILSFSYGQFITVNGTTITDGGGGPSCNSGNFKRVNSATLETNCMRFTNGTFQNGAVWVCNTIDLDQGFKVNFTANFGNNTAGGDGIAFVVQREGAPGVIGGRAGGIGYAQGDGTNCQSAPCPINPSVAVEFDTWDNTADGINDIAANHIAIHRNGEMNAANTLAGPISAISGVNNIRDGLDHAVCITWDPAINRMQVYFDGNLRLTYNGNIRTVFGAGANTVWWGFTAGSGGASQTQRVCNVTMLTNVSSPSCVCTAPVATATPNPQTICSGNATGVNLTSNIAGTTFTWVAAANANVTGESTTNQTGSTITDVLVNTTATAQVVNYTVTPTASGCPGTAITVPVTVNPTPVMTSANSATICSGQTVSIPLTTNPTGSTFTWVATDNANVTGESLTNQTTSTLSNTLTNNSSTVQVVSYTVTPTLNGCSGTPQTVNVTVNPIPTVNAISGQELCAGSPTTAVNFIGNNGSTTYNWTNDNTSIGLAASGSGNIASFTAANGGTTAQVATITVTPVLNGCTGTPQVFTITVNPVPTVDVISSQVLCAGSPTTAINFTGNSGLTTYNWTNDNTSIGLAASGSGNIASFEALNSGSTVQVATITVTPVLGSCSGIPQTFTITVNPIPTVNAISSQELCAGSSTVAVNFSGNIGTTAYEWTNDNMSIGLSGSGTGSIGSFVTLNSGTTAQVATIEVTPNLNGCVGTPQTFTITVNPIPVIALTQTPLSACNAIDGEIEVALTSGSTTSGTVNWTGTASGTSGLTTLPYDMLNLGAGNYNVTFTDANGCVSTTVTSVLNNPGAPIIDAIADYEECNAPYTLLLSTITGDDLTGNQGYFSAPNGGGIQYLDGHIFPVGTNNVQVYVYDIFGLCAAEVSFFVTVNANPTASITPDPAVVCEGVALPLNGNPSGGSGAFTTHSWTIDNSILSSSSIVNPSVLASTVNGTYNLTYTVTDDNGCVGSDNITVAVNETPVLSLNNPAAVCSPSTIDITDVAVSNTTAGTLSYFTDATFTTPLADPTAVGEGTYYVVASNGTCTDNGSVTVTVTETPVLTLNSPAAVCAPATVDITNLAVSSTTVGALAYYADAGLTTPVVDPTSVGNGIYYVQATNLGCTASGSVTVTVNTLPVISGVGNDPSVCNGTDGSIDVNLTSGPLSTGILNWTGTSSGSDVSADLTANPNINGLIAGNYGVTFIDGNGCVSNLISIELINPGAPQITNPGAQTACDSYTLPAISGPVLSGNQSYWTGSGGTGTQLSPGDVLTSTQLIYIYDVFGTCVDEEVFTVTINVTPSIANPGPQVACNNYDLPVITGTNLNAAAYYNNSQANGGTLISGTITSSQTIFIYDQNGSCFDEVSFSVTINPSPVLVSISGGATYCAGADVADILVEVTGSPDYTLGYTLDGTAQTVTSSNGTINLGNAAGTYVVTSLEDAGCTASVSGTQTIVVNPIPVAPIAGDDATYCYFDEFSPMYAQTTLNGTLTWYSDLELTQQVGFGESLLPSTSVGTYTYYVVETAANCQGPSALVTIVVEQCETEIPTAFTPDGDGVNDFWIIPDLSTNFPNNIVRVYNRWGNLIFESEGYATPWDGTYNGAELPVASYYFIVDFNDGGVTKPASGTVTIVRNK
jgi:gliding motility-associated-like protein